MAAQLLHFAGLVAAANPSPGRGDNASDVGGILIIAGIALAVLLLGATLLVVMQRRTRGPRSSRPHRPGRVGRS